MTTLAPILPLPRWRRAVVAVEYQGLREVVSRALVREGWQVDQCAPGEAVGPAARADLVVLDGPRAPEVTAALRGAVWTRLARVVALYGDSCEGCRLTTAGASVVLRKPFGVSELLVAVR